jgi:hypothetical protein
MNEDLSPGYAPKEIKFNGYTTKNLHHVPEAAKAFQDTIKRYGNSHPKQVLNALTSTDVYMGLNDMHLEQGQPPDEKELRRWRIAHQMAKANLESIGDFTHHMDYWHNHEHELQDMLSNYNVQSAGAEMADSYEPQGEHINESLDWGSMSKREFKRRELEHELGHEDRAERQRKSFRSYTNQQKHYHNVPFAKKDDAKKEGMRFDGDKKKWYHTDASKSKSSAFPKLNEEVEQIDELSKGTLDSYREKRSAQLSQVGSEGKPQGDKKLKAFQGVGKAAFKSAMKTEEAELDEAAFAPTMKKAIAAHERGDHKMAKYHLDNAKTARYAMKSTDIVKHKELLDKYKELRDMHEEVELTEASAESLQKKIQAKRDALGLARERRRMKGQHQQSQREIKLQAEIDRLSDELRQSKKGVTEESTYMVSIEGGTAKGKQFGHKSVTVDDHLSAMKYHSGEYQKAMKEKRDSDARHHGMKYHKHKDQIERLGDVGNHYKEEVELDESGPFSYGAKAPRKGSVAYNAMLKRKEQEKNKKPIEPKDQMVGVAKVTKEGVELDEAIKLGSMVKMHAPGKDYHDQVGHVGEIRHGAFKGAAKTYTVDYGDRKSVQLQKNQIKLHKEDVELDEALKGPLSSSDYMKGATRHDLGNADKIEADKQKRREYEKKHVKTFTAPKEKEAQEFAKAHGHKVVKHSYPAGHKNMYNHEWHVVKEEIELDESNEYHKLAAKHRRDLGAKGATPAQKEYARKMTKRALEAAKMSDPVAAKKHYMGVTEEVEQVDEALTDKTIKSSDKIKVARVLADMLGVENVESMSPDAAINAGLRKIKNKRMTPELVGVVKKMLALAKDVGIKVDMTLAPKAVFEATVAPVNRKVKNNIAGGILNFDDYIKLAMMNGEPIDQSEVGHSLGDDDHHLRRMKIKHMHEEEDLEEDQASADYKVNPESGRKYRAHRIDFKNSDMLTSRVEGKPKGVQEEKESNEADDISDEDLDNMVKEIDHEDDIMDLYDDGEIKIIDDETGEEVKEDGVNEEALNEVLSRAERLKARIRFARTAAKRQRRLKIVLAKRSDAKTISKRARRLAINMLKKRIMKKPASQLTVPEKERVEKMLQNKGALINRLSMKLVPRIRKIENDRMSHRQATKPSGDKE